MPEGVSPPNLFLEILKSFVGRSVHTFPILVVALTEKLSRELIRTKIDGSSIIHLIHD